MTLYIKIRNFIESKIFTAILMLLAALAVIFEQEEYGIIVMINLGGLILLFSENITNAYFPGFLGITFVIKIYMDDYASFPHWWFAIVPFTLPAIIAHFIIYRRKITVGKSFLGVLAVAIAITAGGLFSITPQEYFALATIYYTIGLGVGMLGAYLLVRSHTVENNRYDILERYADMLWLVGLFATFMVLEHYARNLETTLLIGKLADIQWSNNISTTLMIAMPFALYKAKKNIGFLALFVANYLAIILTGSRGGWVMGSIEFFICLVVAVFFMGMSRYKRILLGIFGIITIVAGMFAFIMFLDYITTWTNGEFVSHGETRIKIIARSFEDLMTSPIFGKGLGYTGNYDLYKGPPATISWYHMFIPQIAGSLGFVGILCYAKQVGDRFKMIFTKPDAYVWTLGLSYVGLLLMSQVNPGEFCPLPYALVIMTNFVMMERYNEKRGIGYEKNRT